MTIYTVKGVSEILKIPEFTMYDYVRKNVLPSFKIGKHVRIKEKDLWECVETKMQ